MQGFSFLENGRKNKKGEETLYTIELKLKVSSIK